MDALVSILTTAYNHAPYIAQALDSFLMQKTDFPFEVIVHDDASTDGTADIIREYAKKYPDIIKPILQTENQYSQGKNLYDIMAPLIRGKYLALCEGDDYWCDEYKLQKQADYMQAHPECALCFCNSKNVDVDGNLLKVVKPVNISRIFSTEEILSSDGSFCASSGIMYRTDGDIGFGESGLNEGEVEDLPLRCYLALQGTVYGFQDVMACYRRFVPGSWTMRIEKGSDRSVYVQRCKDALNFYKKLYAIADDRHKETVQQQVLKWEFKVCCELSDWKCIRSPRFREHYAQLPIKLKIIIFVKSHFPWAIKLFRLFRYGKKGLSRNY